MDNESDRSDYAQLPREEALVRLYQLQAQLDLEDAVIAAELPPAGPGHCEDCKRARSLLHYGSVIICESCTLSRLAVRRATEARNLMGH